MEFNTSQTEIDKLEVAITELEEATSLTKPYKAQKIISRVHQLARTASGVEFLYHKSLELEEKGLFTNTPWGNINALVPSLVRGTLFAGHPSSTYELISDLRILAKIKGGHWKNREEELALKTYLEEVLVHNLEFALGEITEESRIVMTKVELQKAITLFRFLLESMDLGQVKQKLAEEIRLLCAQRPVVTRRVRKLIQLVSERLTLDDSDEADEQLKYFTEAIYSPTPLTSEGPTTDQYIAILESASTKAIEKEARSLGVYLQDTGLTNPYLAVILHFLSEKNPSLIPLALGLNDRGKAEWTKQEDYIIKIIRETVGIGNHQCIYGLARMMDKNIFSRKALRASYNNLRLVSVHPQVEKRILKSMLEPDVDVSAKQYLLGATLRILGQPLGVGQGNNATCQSARGISLWSQYAPAKLINMIITVCTQDNLIMRFESHELESIKLSKGLMDKLDHQLDAVSVILVPHLDKIYSAMMQLASGRLEDPHKWVNPAFYGYWVPLGFASAYDYRTNSILDFKGFIRLLISTFHPDFNGGREIVYPVPVGIFITSSSGNMIGFHAVSMLRVNRDEHTGETRVYFLNPNNEGRQNWGQGIAPSVDGHGEMPGESSLPFISFAARIYAFHFNPLSREQEIPAEISEGPVNSIYKLAKESWGAKYTWNDTLKLW